MTGSPNVVLERDGTIQIIRLARPEKKNAITAAMYGALASAIAATNHDPAVRVVMIEGAEGVFCAGNDLDDFLRHPPAGPESEVFRFLNAISTADKPLVAAVAGPAVGIGTTMLLHCDLVYAAENAKFAMPFVNLGICPEAASSYLLPLVAGYQRAAELLLLGEPFGQTHGAAFALALAGLLLATWPSRASPGGAERGSGATAAAPPQASSPAEARP